MSKFPSKLFRKNVILFLLVIFLFIKVQGQTTITGILRNDSNELVQHVSITYSSTQNTSILGFALSDNKGSYLLRLNPSMDSILIRFSCLGYKDKMIRIKVSSQQLNCILEKSFNKLPDIVVKAPPIQQIDDSLNYNVASFKNEKDRSIADVLKKMPGIGVSEDGQIYYQGKSIQKLSVNGSDLMEGRYNIITTNLPALSVSKVQVIQNDQIIKILDSLVPSNKVSINLKLKKTTATGNIELAVGGSPLIRDINITHMIFSKQFQTVNSFSSNNTGRDAAKLLKHFSSGTIYDNTGTTDQLSTQTSIQGLPIPSFESTRWLHNNINLFASNTLWKLSRDWEIKVNSGYINDHQQQVGNTVSSILTGNQVITVEEHQYNTYNINHVFGGFTTEKNTKKLFFRNNFNIEKKWNNNIGQLLLSGDSILQRHKSSELNLSNRLVVIFPLGRQLITFNNQVNYTSLPESLLIEPGPFPEIINDSIPYKSASQDVFSKKILINNYLEMNKSFGNFTLSPKIGFQIDNSELRSSIESFDGLTWSKPRNQLSNELTFRQNEFYTEISSSFKHGKWLWLFHLPIQFTHYKLETAKDTILNKLIFQPNLFGEYALSTTFKVSYSFSRNSAMPNIYSLYSGYLLTGYMNLQRHTTWISEQVDYNHSLGLEYKDAIKNIFFSTHFTIINSEATSMDNTDVNSKGATTVNTIQQKIHSSGWSNSFEGSQFLTQIKTIIKIKSQLQYSKTERNIDDTLVGIHNKVVFIQGSIISDFSHYLSVEYTTGTSFIHSKVGAGENKFSAQWKYHLGLNIQPFERHVLNISSDLYTTNVTNSKNQFLMDVSYRIMPSQSKIDLALYCTNLFNTSYYTSFYDNLYTSIQSHYKLRERQFMLSYKLSF